MTEAERFVLTLSCHDVKGIVAAVSGFLAQQDCFIVESAQFGDPSTNRFFMRCEFTRGPLSPERQHLQASFQPIAGRFGMDWALHSQNERTRLLLLVTKASHCLNDILHRVHSGWLKADVPVVASNHETLRPMAEFYRIPFVHLPVRSDNRAEQEAQIMELVERHRIDLVVLARYMQVLSPWLVERLQGRAINIHHSFLPSFKGSRPYHQAYNRGVKLVGATAHYVTDALDEGPIIEQEVLRVDHNLGPDELASMGLDVESLALARAIKYHTEHRVLLNDHKTVVFR